MEASITLTGEQWTIVDCELAWSERSLAHDALQEIGTKMEEQGIHADGEGQWLAPDLITILPDPITVQHLSTLTLIEIQLISVEHNFEPTIWVTAVHAPA